MSLSAEQKSQIVKDHARGASDTGSPEVQVALLSARINDLSDHFKTHIHDHHSRQGLLQMVRSRFNRKSRPPQISINAKL